MFQCSSTSAQSTDSPIDLFDVGSKPAEPVKVYASKPPALLPERAPAAGVDLFDVTPSPSVEALKAHAEKRFAPERDRTHVVGMCAEGVIGSYDEAHRIAVRDRKPLRVLVGAEWSEIVRQGKAAAADGVVVCRVDVGEDERFRGRGVYEYEPAGDGQLYSKPAATPCRSCTAEGCPCRYGGTCVCNQATTSPAIAQPRPFIWPTYHPGAVLSPTFPSPGAFASPWSNAGGSACASGRCGR